MLIPASDRAVDGAVIVTGHPSLREVGEAARPVGRRVALRPPRRGLWVGLMLVTMSGTAYGQLSASDIAALEERGQAEGWTFTVGENEATNRPRHQLHGLVEPPNWRATARFDASTLRDELPATFDWRNHNGRSYCSPVRNQGTCGSCWAFAAIGTVESTLLINKFPDGLGVSVDLSEQWLISCTGAGGCGGGWHTRAYEYLMLDGLLDFCGDSGAVLEVAFPYTESDSACGCPYTHPYSIYSWVVVGPDGGTPGVEQIKQAIMDYGPVSTCVRVTDAFQAYTGGVFNVCEEGEINHAVDLVGWNDNMGTAGVWILRNSWSSWWGESGYMYIEYGCSEIGYATCYVNYFPQDCNSNGIPDRCDVDCEEPGGECDVAGCGGSPDCNGNRIPDECDIGSGMSTDHNGNGIPDECEPDCNGNGVPDECDVSCDGNCASAPDCGHSVDCQPDGTPDECQVMGLVVPSGASSCSASANGGTPWCEDFEGYALGSIEGNNGWDGWGDDPNVVGSVTDEQNHTPGGLQSLRIQDDDTVRMFYGYDVTRSPTWVLSAFVYVPSSMSGDAYFILNPDYAGPQGDTWAVQMVMNVASGTVANDYGIESLPLMVDAWAEIRCEIDFESDLVTIHYGGVFLARHEWTHQGGSLNLSAIDLFSPDSSGFYFDDLSLFPAISRDCNRNSVPDDCDITAGTSLDDDTDGIPDECLCTDDSECDDGLFCTGVERCVDELCIHTDLPCPGQICVEDQQICVDCLVGTDCDDGLFCTGVESCVDNQCQAGSDPCGPDLACDEENDWCYCNDNADCDDANACTVDVCMGVLGCLNTPNDSLCDDSNPCTDDSCDAASGCQNVADDTNSCGDSAYCNGSESCSGGACVSSGSPCPADKYCDEQRRACVECLSGGDCDDDDSCTVDTCPGGTCSHVLLPACEDDDDDGVINRDDDCASTPSGQEVDANGCSCSQLDSDDDDVDDCIDACSDTPAGEQADDTGCSCSQLDDDADGVDNCDDDCPDTAADEEVDDAGCADTQLDDDDDGVPNSDDLCASSPAVTPVDEAGCADSQLDDDGDGVSNDVDRCPSSPEEADVNANGCALSELDDDGDGVANDLDQCSGTPLGVDVDDDGCSLAQLAPVVDELAEALLPEVVGDGEETSSGTSRRVCGIFGMIPLVVIFAGLAAMRDRSRRRTRPAA